MRLSEAIRLGSLAIQNPRAGDAKFCAIGMGLTAVNKLHVIEITGNENYDEIRSQWPWVKTIWNGPIGCRGFIAETYLSAIWYMFDRMVMDDKTMTLEALCDQVRAWEDELAAKGINVEQVTMAAELNQPASQAAENIPELDVKLEQDVAK